MLFGLLQSIGDVFVGLIPADALPLVDAAQIAVRVVGRPILALHGVFQAICRENLFALGVSAQARALLRIIGAVLMAVVSLLTNNDAIFHQHFINAAAAAVVPACCRLPFAVDDIAAVGACRYCRFFGLFDLVGGTSRQARCRQRSRSSSGRRHEAAAAHLRCLLHAIEIAHCFPLLQFPLERLALAFLVFRPNSRLRIAPINDNAAFIECFLPKSF